MAQCADDGVCRTINAYDLAALLASGAGRLSAVLKFLFWEQSLFSLNSELSIIFTFHKRQSIWSKCTKQISQIIYLPFKRFFSIYVKVIIVERVVTVEEIIQVKIPVRGWGKGEGVALSLKVKLVKGKASLWSSESNFWTKTVFQMSCSGNIPVFLTCSCTNNKKSQ